MQTFVGKVGIFDEYEDHFKNGVLNLDGYVSTITYNDGSSTEITIRDDINYMVEVDHVYEELIFIRNENNHISYSILLEEDRDNKLNLIQAHFKNLNLSLEKKQQDFLLEINNNLDVILEDSKIKQLLHNYIDKTNRSIFLDSKSLICFERLLYFRFSIGKLSLLTSNYNENLLKFGGIIEGYEDVIDSDSLINYYENFFIKLVKILNKRLNFNDESEGVFVTWNLLIKEICQYYYEKFKIEYGMHFINIQDLSLKDCLKIYTSIDLLDIESATNANIFTYFLMYNRKFEKNDNFLVCNSFLVEELLKVINDKDLEDFERSLLEPIVITEYSIDDTDLMTGYEFEEFISYLFQKMGFSTEVTKSSYDQGIDLIIEKDGQKIGVQTKCSSTSVSNKAIQEVVAGLKHYNLDKGIVITNNYYTNSAKELASSNEIILWDRRLLVEKIHKFL